MGYRNHDPSKFFGYTIKLEGDRSAVEAAVRRLFPDGSAPEVIDLTEVCHIPDSLLRAYDALNGWEYPCYVNAFVYDAEDMEMFYHYLDTEELDIPEELFHYDEDQLDEHNEYGRVFPQGKQALQVWLLLHHNDLIQKGELAGDAVTECGTSDLNEWCEENWNMPSPYLTVIKSGWDGDSYELVPQPLADSIALKVFREMAKAMPGVRLTVKLWPWTEEEYLKTLGKGYHWLVSEVFEDGKLISRETKGSKHEN